MNRTIKSLVVAGAIALLFSALSVGIVFAEGDGDGGSDPSDTTEETKQSRAEEARADFAEALGVTVEDLDAAFQEIALDRIDDALDAGTITEERAAELRTAIESGEGKGRFLARGRFLRGGSDNREALAEALDVSVDDLVAAGKQVALDRVDEAVESGKITEEKAEELRTAIESGEKLDRGRGHDKGSWRNWDRGDKGGRITIDKATTE